MPQKWSKSGSLHQKPHFTISASEKKNAIHQGIISIDDLSLREYLVNKYALWLDFRTIDENELHGMGRRIENASEGITLQTEKKAETAGALSAYIYLIMDAQLNIENGAYISAVY